MRNAISLFLLLLFSACIQNKDVRDSPLAKVQEVDLASIDPDLFSEAEWYIPYYLKHFSAVANAVVDTGDNRGFMSLPVWRSRGRNHIYNARVMEGILNLVWFYTNDRPWNPYYNDPALKARIEAALTFWCNMQSDEGKFSQNRKGDFKLSPTAFATKFVGRALWLLDKGPGIDKDVFERSGLAIRKALYISFTDEKMWKFGTYASNQYGNLWGGAMMYLDIWPDEEIETLLRQRLLQSLETSQSPAGYFYERDGPDFGYSLDTHHSDLHVAWEYAKGTEFQDEFVKKSEYWYDWFSYNALKEPGTSCYYLNRAIETRQRKAYDISDELADPTYQRWVPQAEFVPMARAFQLSVQENVSSQKKNYAAMRKLYPKVDSLQVGSFRAFAPYAFIHEGMGKWLPSQAEKEEAVASLPYLKKTNFIHVKKDSRYPLSFTFVRKPSYYAVFNSGKILIDSMQRYGLGMLWNPIMGTVIQSQSYCNVAAYGTTPEGEEKVYEASDIFAQMLLNGQIIEPAVGKNDFKGEAFSVSYKLGMTGNKEIFFKDDKLIVKIKHSGKFIETIPILKSAENELTWNDHQIVLKSEEVTMIIDVKNSTGIKEMVVEADLYKKECHSFKISANESLEYRINFK